MGKSILWLLLLAAHAACAQGETGKDSIAEKLDEIQIVKQAQAFTNKNGNIKADVANTALGAVPNTLDLLARIPTVQVSPDKESITVIGEGAPLLYIDRQKATIEDLNSLAVDDIRSVEIIRNPSARYESDWRSVLLITRKAGRKDGFKINVAENASFKRYFNNYLGINSNFKNNKTEFKLNANYNQLVQWESNANDFSIPAQGIDSDYRVAVYTPRPQYILGGGVFYKINDEDYLSFTVSNRYQGDSDRLVSDSRYRKNAVYNAIVTKNNSDESRNFLNSFINYAAKMGNSFRLFAGMQYSNFRNHSENLIYNDFNQDGAQLKQNRDQRFKVQVASARIDVEKTFSGSVTCEAGLLYLSAHAGTNLDLYDYDDMAADSSAYRHLENNSAAYVQFAAKQKKWSYGAGLRIERTGIDGGFAGNGSSVSKHYTGFFPKANMTYAIDSTRSLTLNYSRSISRPNYSSANLSPTYINPYFVFSGNINLDPAMTNEVSLGFQQKGNYFGITFHRSENPAYYGFEYDATVNILTFKPVNFDSETGLDITVSMPFSYKSWSTNLTLSGMYNNIEDRLAASKDAKPYLYYFSDHTFRFRKGFSLTLTGWGLTKRNEGVFDKNAYFITNLALVKTIAGGWVFTAGCNDIFHQMDFTEKFTMDGIRSNVRYFTDTREFAVSVKYSFGSIRDSAYKEKEVDENSGRIK